MKKIIMSEKAYVIVGDLANVHRAQDALREICQPNSTDYISEKDYQAVMKILAKWSDEMFKRIECNDGEAQQERAANMCCNCGHEVQFVKPGKWQCNNCDARERSMR